MNINTAPTDIKLALLYDRNNNSMRSAMEINTYEKNINITDKLNLTLINSS
jgi:hypothetical protein